MRKSILVEVSREVHLTIVMNNFRVGTSAAIHLFSGNRYDTGHNDLSRTFAPVSASNLTLVVLIVLYTESRYKPKAEQAAVAGTAGEASADRQCHAGKLHDDLRHEALFHGGRDQHAHKDIGLGEGGLGLFVDAEDVIQGTGVDDSVPIPIGDPRAACCSWKCMTRTAPDVTEVLCGSMSRGVPSTPT